MSPEKAMLSILQAFDKDYKPDTLSIIKNDYTSLLNRIKIALILDNAKDGTQVIPLDTSNNSLIIVTSRERLFLSAAFEKKVNKMSTKDAIDLLHSITDECRFNGKEKEVAKLIDYLPMAILPLAKILKIYGRKTVENLIEKYKESKQRLLLQDPNRNK